ncbi:hypothetical protein GYMLUDRAFT_249298 [Collybiopsis luxurians FD-317 M1]|uniref:Ribonuclease H1 N-terminal domain-containing protein n=1 Tax=Collybiopsis luxurians FD-317 M1 TaxID=944289 RepID=A0A0D0AW38_9AGAR|nr:hypothetical protein GYMLUDRAFT_249298 [Collybiopsis luxurians FD-317 M1]
MSDICDQNPSGAIITLSDDQLNLLVARVMTGVFAAYHAQPQTSVGTNITNTVHSPEPLAAVVVPAVAPEVTPAPVTPAPAVSASPVPSSAPTSLATDMNQEPVCARCGYQAPEESWYVVTVGKAVGIFPDAAFAQSLILGVSGGSWKKYSSHANAQSAYQAAIASKIVCMVV